jgi:chorismate mutase/prephenate dehydratase
MARNKTHSTPDSVRDAIADVDAQILDLVQRRAELVRQDRGDQPQASVGCVAEASRRIDQLIKNSGSEPAIGSDRAAALLRHISSACLQAIQPIQVALLGPKFSYSHLAGLKYFGDAAEFTSVASIPAVFDSVSRGDSTTGLVPIENSTDGRIVDTLGMFVRRDMQICGEVLLPIHHNLLSKTKREEVREIHSKPQALSQCRGWLAANMPEAELVEVSSTTMAAEHAQRTHGVAAVASLEAGRQYDLDVLNTNIEDNPNNVTRFAVLGREQPLPTGDDKTSLLFQVHHRPGALADAMTIFKLQSLNLTWIESFPAPDTQNEYLFFVELSGHRSDQNVAQAIELLSEATCRLEVLGSYPRARLDESL